VAFEYTDASGWKELPSMPIDGQASTVTWVDGAGLLAWNYGLESALLEPSGSWLELDPVPMDFAECYPQSTSIAGGAVGLCGGLAWFDAAIREWTPIRQMFDTRYVASTDAIYGLVRIDRDETQLIRHPPPMRQ
jgi:hypothetical protein